MLSSLRRIAAISIGACTLAVAIAAAPAGASPQQATLQSFVGTWTCITHGNDNKTYRETDVDSMYGNWLKIESDYPAQNGAPAGTATTFVGYDGKHGHWIATGVGTDDSYFTSYSKWPKFDGSKWYDAYPNDHGTATFQMPTSTSYTMQSVTPNAKGVMSSSHSICTKH
ncbi:MAG: hypothetical protein WB615_07720 [Candidatus Tumulicola sp.]